MHSRSWKMMNWCGVFSTTKCRWEWNILLLRKGGIYYRCFMLFHSGGWNTFHKGKGAEGLRLFLPIRIYLYENKNRNVDTYCINIAVLIWRKRWDSNPRAREGYLISSFPSVCYLHGFSCQFQSVLYARKPAWNLDFLKKSPENTEKSPIGSNQRFFRFWKELRKERKEQKSKSNTRTVRMPAKLTKIWGVLSWKKTQSTGTPFPI